MAARRCLESQSFPLSICLASQDRFTDESRRDAAAQVVDRGYPVRKVAERLEISTKSIYTWQKLFSRPEKVIQEVDTQADEIRRLKRDFNPVLCTLVAGKLSGQWSPQQIAGWLSGNGRRITGSAFSPCYALHDLGHDPHALPPMPERSRQNRSRPRRIALCDTP